MEVVAARENLDLRRASWREGGGSEAGIGAAISYLCDIPPQSPRTLQPGEK